jgi:hypothetical protein
VACDPKNPGGLFCNGQYVDSGNNLQNCIDALKAQLNITVSGSSSCSGNSCQAEGEASASCATAPVRGGRGLGAAAGLLAALGALVVARRRRA